MRVFLFALLGSLVVTATAGAVGSGPAGPRAYEDSAFPLLQRRCLGCHGERQPHAGFSVAQWGDIREGGYSGSGVVPGKPEASLLYQMLKDGRMPKGGTRFSERELAIVAEWIRSGATGRTASRGHWAFRTPQRPAVPRVREPKQVRNPVDAFVLAELEKRGLTFSPEPDRRTLLRRLTLDLIGLPPTPEEAAEFERDTRPDAYERVVDRLLADARHGERWARHWLDAAGYAESEGVLQEDRVRTNSWRYRDYVIRSFNRDLPYDQFLREQLAGDELADYRNVRAWTPEVVDRVAATGFLRTAVDATRDDFNPHQYGEYQYRMLHDTQTIVGTALLGLQVQCARCHSHKYEPISQRDYYRLQGIFYAAVRPRGTLLPTSRRQIVAATEAEQKAAAQANALVDAAVARVNRELEVLLQEHRLRRLQENLGELPEAERSPVLAAARLEEARRTPEQKALLMRYRALVLSTEAELGKLSAEYRERRAALVKRREAEEKKRVLLPSIRAFYDQDAAPPPTPFLTRGDWLRPADPVEPGIPAILEDPSRPFRLGSPGSGAYTTGRRTALAAWITRPDHPLTARVLVNRVWFHHFGAGLVSTLDNFGRSGARPSHPALLDWLARTFVETGWSLKRLHRLLVTSSAYRQGTAWQSQSVRVDPDNVWLWRQRPRRLEAEAVRDSVLAVAGTLNPEMFGEPVGLETRGSGEVVAAEEGGRSRRSLYLLVRRTQPVAFLNAFDHPVLETNCTRRTVSATPVQALAQMNSGFLTAQSRNWAQRLLREQPGEPVAPRTRVERAFELAFCRKPAAVEVERSAAFLHDQTARYRALGRGQSALEEAWGDFCQALLSANEFLYVD